MGKECAAFDVCRLVFSSKREIAMHSLSLHIDPMFHSNFHSGPNAEARRGLLIVSSLLCLMLLVAYLFRLHWQHGYLFDYAPLVIGRDFMNFWMAGKTAWQPQIAPWYDVLDYSARLQAFLGADYAVQHWSYPPNIMLAAAPFGLLPYSGALSLWWLLQAVALLWLWRRDKEDAMLLLASPALLLAVISGQASIFFLCISICLFENMDRRPVHAGAMLGLFALKPPLMMLMPIALLARGKWRMIGAAILVCLLSAVCVVLLYGTGPWVAYWQHGMPDQAQIMQHAPRVIAALMPTLFIELRMMHVPIAWCYASQAVAVMFAGFLVWRGFRTSHDTPQGPVLRFALFAAAAVFASPYWMGYDLLMLTWAVIGVLRVNAWKNMRIWLCIALYFLPVLCFVLHVLGLPGMPLLILTFAFWMLREIKHAHAPSAASPDAAANDSTPAKPALR